MNGWIDEEGHTLTCTGKLRVLRENERELKQVLIDAYEDAILMGVSKSHMRIKLCALVNTVVAECEQEASQ